MSHSIDIFGIDINLFLLMVINIVFVLYLMSISKKIGLDMKQWIKYSFIIYIILYLIALFILWNKVSWFNLDVFSIMSPITISFIFLSLLLSFAYVYLWKKREIPKKYKDDDSQKRLSVTMAIFSVVIMISVSLTIEWVNEGIIEYNREALNLEKLISNYITCEYWVNNETEHGFNSKLVEIRIYNNYTDQFDSLRIDIKFPQQIDNVTIEYNTTYLNNSNRDDDITSIYDDYDNAYGIVFSKIISNDTISVQFLTGWKTNISEDIKNKLLPSVEIMVAGKNIDGLKVDGPFWWPPPKLGGPE